MTRCSIADSDKRNSTLWYVVLGVATILIAVGLFLSKSNIPKTLRPLDPEAMPRSENFDPDISPPGFPNIFVEEDVKWLRSSVSTYPQGKVSGTRIYRTSFGPATVYERYLSSLTGWVVDDYQSLSGGTYLIAARGQGGALAISIDPLPEGQSKVTVTFIKDK